MGIPGRVSLLGRRRIKPGRGRSPKGEEQSDKSSATDGENGARGKRCDMDEADRPIERERLSHSLIAWLDGGVFILGRGLISRKNVKTAWTSTMHLPLRISQLPQPTIERVTVKCLPP